MKTALLIILVPVAIIVLAQVVFAVGMLLADRKAKREEPRQKSD